MADPLVVGTAGAVLAYLSKDGLAKLLGPTAEYLGDGLKSYTQKRLENIGAIFSNAECKLGDEINNNGSVPPKVLKEILDSGSYSEDNLAVEYFGGVLASSRTTVDRDDRGARVSKIVAGMSSYQLRAHYIVYNSVAKTFSRAGYSLSYMDRVKMEIYFPMANFLAAMDFSHGELSQFDSIMRHTFFGLHADNLIEGRLMYGNNIELDEGTSVRKGNGVLCQPSALGVDVFLWAHGRGALHADSIFADDFQTILDHEIIDLAGGVAASPTS